MIDLDRAACSFWWKSILKLIPDYKQFAQVKVGRGDTTLLWLDNWSNEALKDRFLELFSFCLHENISITDVWVASDFIELFHTPLSNQAYQQYQEFCLTIQQSHF